MTRGHDHRERLRLSLLYYLLVYCGIMCDFLVVNDDFFNFPCANWKNQTNKKREREREDERKCFSNNKDSCISLFLSLKS